MKATKLGIWMDHEHARLTEFTTDPMTTVEIKNKFSSPIRQQALSHGEQGMHQKEQHAQATFYKELAGKIKDYKEVVLFGPTGAKSELANLIKADHKLDHLVVRIADTDKMSNEQIQAFVRKYFGKNI